MAPRRKSGKDAGENGQTSAGGQTSAEPVTILSLPDNVLELIAHYTIYRPSAETADADSEVASFYADMLGYGAWSDAALLASCVRLAKAAQRAQRRCVLIGDAGACVEWAAAVNADPTRGPMVRDLYIDSSDERANVSAAALRLIARQLSGLERLVFCCAIDVERLRHDLFRAIDELPKLTMLSLQASPSEYVGMDSRTWISLSNGVGQRLRRLELSGVEAGDDISLISVPIMPHLQELAWVTPDEFSTLHLALQAFVKSMPAVCCLRLGVAPLSAAENKLLAQALEPWSPQLRSLALTTTLDGDEPPRQSVLIDDKPMFDVLVLKFPRLCRVLVDCPAAIGPDGFDALVDRIEAFGSADWSACEPTWSQAMLDFIYRSPTLKLLMIQRIIRMRGDPPVTPPSAIELGIVDVR